MHGIDPKTLRKHYREELNVGKIADTIGPLRRLHLARDREVIVGMSIVEAQRLISDAIEIATAADKSVKSRWPASSRRHIGAPSGDEIC